MNLIYGVGINDAPKKAGSCPIHRKWRSMLQRCYSEKCLKKHPSYANTTVCDEWLTYSNFKLWMEAQDWEGLELDKDLLDPIGRVYSPETCVFIPQGLNRLLTIRKEGIGELPVGVKAIPDSTVNPYISRINIDGKSKYLGVFPTIELARQAYIVEKKKHLTYYMETATNPKIKEALATWWERSCQG